jgi:hypothetical protein
MLTLETQLAALEAELDQMLEHVASLGARNPLAVCLAQQLTLQVLEGALHWDQLWEVDQRFLLSMALLGTRMAGAAAMRRHLQLNTPEITDP